MLTQVSANVLILLDLHISERNSLFCKNLPQGICEFLVSYVLKSTSGFNLLQSLNLILISSHASVLSFLLQHDPEVKRGLLFLICPKHHPTWHLRMGRLLEMFETWSGWRRGSQGKPQCLPYSSRKQTALHFDIKHPCP